MPCFREMRLLALLSIVLLAGVLARWWFWLGPGQAEIIWASPNSSSAAPGEEGASVDGAATSSEETSNSGTQSAAGENANIQSNNNTETTSGANVPILPYETAISTVESAYGPGAGQGSGATTPASDTSASAANEEASAPVGAESGATVRLDLNTATKEQLLTLPGIGPVLAQAILDERARRGRFTAITDLLAVKGIGQARLEKLTPFVCVINP